MKEKGIFIQLGLVDYRQAWELQQRLWAKRVSGIVPDTVLFLEHSHTITLGRRGNDSHLKASPEELERLDIPVVQVERGGDVTYHGPNQAVVYPILQLEAFGLNVTQYIDLLEECIIQVLKDFAVDGKRSPKNRGVWVGEQKIASIGVALRQGVSFHGLALNYNTDLKYFDLIDACGLKNVRITSMAEILGCEVFKDDLYKRLSFHFKNLFKKDWQEKPLREVEEL